MEVGGSPSVVHKVSVNKDPERAFVILRRSRRTYVMSYLQENNTILAFLERPIQLNDHRSMN
jgi:hypothetical protein